MRIRVTLATPLLGVALGLILAACGEPAGNTDGGTTDAGTDGGSDQCQLHEANCCTRSPDCKHLNGTYTAYCDKSVGACEYLCNADSDCAGESFMPDQCAGGACVCDEGYCKIPACSADADCQDPNLACVGGSCEDRTALPAATSCVIAPAPVYLHEGATLQLKAYALVDGKYAVTDGSFSWASDDASAVTVDSATGEITGGTATAAATVTATIGSATCDVTVNNYAAIGGSDVRVLVLDELTRQPVEGATVVVYDPDGEAGQGSTAIDGTITLQGISAAEVDVHVFTPSTGTASAPNGYAYVSAVGISDKDLVVYLPRNAVPGQAGGFKGTMTKADFDKLGTDDVHIALAGASIPGNFIDIDLNILIGELITTHVEYGSVINDDLPLPSGLVMGIGNDFFKSDYMPLAVPGLRTAWALGGNLPLTQVTQVLAPVLGGGTSDIQIGPLVGALLPLFGSFYSGIQPGVNIEEYPRVDDGSGNMLPDFSKFPNETIDIDTALSLKGVVTIPTLPQMQTVDDQGNPTTKYLDGAIVLGGVLVDGQGLVPLGITAAMDVNDATTETPNGIVNDSDTDSNNDGKAVIRLAPQHGGIEGSEYVLLGLALGLDSIGGSGGGQAISGFARRVNRIEFEQALDFGASQFLGLAQSATVDVNTDGSASYTPADVSGASFYRLAIDSPDEHTWVVYHGPGLGTVGLVNPSDYTCGTSACEDRLTAASNVDAQAVETADGASLDDVIGFTGENLDEMVKVLKGFSTVNVTVNQGP